MLRDKIYFSGILEPARIIQQHLASMSREALLQDLRTQDAVTRRFEIIGEAARRQSVWVDAALVQSRFPRHTSRSVPQGRAGFGLFAVEISGVAFIMPR